MRYRSLNSVASPSPPLDGEEGPLSPGGEEDPESHPITATSESVRRGMRHSESAPNLAQGSQVPLRNQVDLEERKIVVGICAMDKKTRAKPMQVGGGGEGGKEGSSVERSVAPPVMILTMPGWLRLV